LLGTKLTASVLTRALLGHATAAIFITDVVLSVVKPVRSSLVEIAVSLLLLLLLLLAEAFRPLRSVSRMSKRLALFNLLVDESKWVVVGVLDLVYYLLLLGLLLVEGSHAELLVG